ENHLGHQQTGYRPVHKTMPREASDDIVAPKDLHWPDDRVRVGGHFVQAGPMGHQAHSLQQRQPFNGLFHMYKLPLFIYPFVKTRLLMWVGHPGQQPFSLWMEIKALCKINDK